MVLMSSAQGFDTKCKFDYYHLYVSKRTKNGHLNTVGVIYCNGFPSPSLASVADENLHSSIWVVLQR